MATDELDPRILDRRRRRREQERKRAAGVRRRRALYAAALLAFGVGGALGAAREAEPPERAAPTIADEEPAPPPTVENFRGPVPILMYHAIETAPADSGFPALYVPYAEFKDQLRWLARNGYNAVTLDEVYAAWEEGEPIARDPVVLSFDDGMNNQHQRAMPALAKHGWPGVLFLTVRNVDQGDLGEDQVEEMIAAGWTIDAHTLTHPDLSTLDGEELKAEVAGARQELQERFGVGANFIAYPSGRYDDEVIEAARDAGYLGATTTEPGLGRREEMFELRRIRVEPGDGASGLADKLDRLPGLFGGRGTG
jgi:peptidoglycan/xylan/chitin deacetylase (PgdA/CDA1 family)